MSRLIITWLGNHRWCITCVRSFVNSQRGFWCGWSRTVLTFVRQFIFMSEHMIVEASFILQLFTTHLTFKYPLVYIRSDVFQLIRRLLNVVIVLFIITIDNNSMRIDYFHFWLLFDPHQQVVVFAKMQAFFAHCDQIRLQFSAILFVYTCCRFENIHKAKMHSTSRQRAVISLKFIYYIFSFSYVYLFVGIKD